MSSTINLLDEKINFGALKEGLNHVDTKDGKAKFTAHVADGKVTALSASAPDGKAFRLTNLQEGEPGSTTVLCWVCLDSPGGRWCYEIECKDLPSPKKQSLPSRS